MIRIIPAIDIIGGRCVRLSRGDYSLSKTYEGSPVEMACAFEACGVEKIHMVDLDGAKAGRPCNLDVLRQVAGSVKCCIEWGGGISSSEALDAVFEAGATQAIVGSVAAMQPELFRSWLRTYGPGRIILGADVRDSKVAVKGWLQDSGVLIDGLIQGFLPDGISEVICTDISRDGMLQGPSDELYLRLQEAYPGILFTVSGGISGPGDILRLEREGLRSVIVGKAIYEGKITLEQIRQWSQNA